MLTRKMVVTMLMVFWATMSTTALGTHYYVDANSGDDANDGQSWEDAFATIQKGLDTASNGDIVEVNEGTYYETVDFNGVACTVTSTEPNDLNVIKATIIDANCDANNPGRVVTFDNGESADSVLSGFTITGGYANGSSYPAYMGGGIYCYNASPTIIKCRIINNKAGVYGGGMCNYYSACPTVTNCVFANNSAIGNGVYGGYGGGISNLEYSTATLINCTFSKNSAYIDNSNGGYGGGMLNVLSSPEITNCIFWGNYADNEDNEVHNSTASDPNFSYCDVKGCGGSGNWDPNFGTDLGGNISSYPYFADYDGNDFHLTWNSPCINKGDPNGDYTGQTDIDGEPRVADEEFVDERVDIGADEFNLAHITLVENPGFELGGGGQLWQYVDSNYIPVEDDNVPLYWEAWSVDETIIDSNGHSGEHSWKIISDNITSYSYGKSNYPDYISVGQGRIYKLSGWVRSETGDEEIHFGWREYDANKNDIRGSYILYYDTVPVTWTKYEGYLKATNPNTAFVRVLITGPTRRDSMQGWHGGAIWWDDIILSEQVEFLSPYGCAHETDVVKTIEFGGDEKNINWVAGDINSVMSEPCADANDNNITYRELKANKYVKMKFPCFNLDEGYDSNNPYDMNSLPLTHMLLEVMSKDIYDDKVTYPATTRSDWGDLVVLCSNTGYMDPDPDYFFIDPNERRYYLGHVGGADDGEWKYYQYAFQKSDYQLLRAIDGFFDIRIYNNTDMNLPIDYVSLRTITDQEYRDLTGKQREFRGFYEVQMPADNPTGPSYGDPNLVVFSRNIMRPVYKHTKPATNEPNSITGFGCRGEIEPVSFSIYSESGLNDLSITVSNLVHTEDSNEYIDSNDILTSHVIYDETRLSYVSGPLSFALLPDRLKEFTTLSVDPNTSERILMNIWVPESGLAGLYEGQVTISRPSEPNTTVDIDFTIYDIDLAHKPSHLNAIYHCPHSRILSSDIDVVYEAYEETQVEPFIYSYSARVLAEPNGAASYGLDLNSVNFEASIDGMMDGGIIEAGDKIFMHIHHYTWGYAYSGYSNIYKIVMGEPFDGTNEYLYSNLSDANFVGGFKKLLGVYADIAEKRNFQFILEIWDEPGDDPFKRITSDRLYNIIKDYNDPNFATGVTYYTPSDEELHLDPNDANTNPYGYKLPYSDPFDPNIILDDNLPPLTDLVDYKLWSPSYQYDGYTKSQDPNYHGIYGYYTTGHSHCRNPVYNRFLHGLFAFGTDAKAIGAYAMGSVINDPYNDFDGGYQYLFPFTYPDFLYAYPTWSGELLYTIGGLEGIREGIKDAKYIATLKNLIDSDPNAPVAQVAQDYLDEIKSRIGKNYVGDYYYERTELGYYQDILEDISEVDDPNDFEAFSEIRKTIADFIVLLDSGINYRVHNLDQDTWYTTINDAIDSAASGDEIVVYGDTYYETVDFDGKAITVRSTNPNDDNVVAATIIDANNLGRVVTFDGGEDANSVLTGFTITGGYTSYPSDGAGIYCYGSSPTISRCVIYDNDAGDDGGGISCDNSSSPTISYCLITSNEAGDGAGICCNNSSSPTISYCDITDNDADDKGGGIYCKANSIPPIEDCEISLNNAYKGGGMYCNASEPQIERCIISDNQTFGSGADGGAVYCSSSNPNILSCIISGNISDDDGGGICCDASDPNIINCTLTENEADDRGGAIYCKNSSDAVITNCILWDDTASTGDEIYTSSSTPVVTYSDIEGGYSGTGNINTDPCFVNPDVNDFHLDWDSPCINAGDPNRDYTGQTDIDGESRVMRERVDMGADEIPRVHNITQNKWYVHINGAIAEANDADEIEVYEGIFYESIEIDVNSIILRSTDPNDWTVVADTIIDANNATYGIKYTYYLDSTLAGLTIRNASYYGIQCMTYSSPTIKNCIVEENDYYGIIPFMSGATIINNKIRQNTYSGIHVIGTATQEIKNNWIYDNAQGIYLAGSSADKIIRNNTIVGNPTAGIYKISGTSPTISNCILWDNDSNDLVGCTATYSCIEDCNDANGVGNICGDPNDPNFVDPNNDDYHLDPNSPCIDTGDPNGVYTGELDIDFEVRVVGDDVDMGGDEYKE